MIKSLKWPVLRQSEAEGKRDYGKHFFTGAEQICRLFKCIGIVLLLCCFFYRSLWAFPVLCIPGAIYYKRDAGHKAAQDRRRLLLQFRDLIRSVAASMQAGYSVENAFLESYSDMCMMHGEASFICRELKVIKRGLVINLTLEELLEDLGKRSKTAQIREFASVFAIARRNGGNMTQVIHTSAELIHRKVETEEEILLQTAARRMERNIMNLMPFAILLYVDIGNKGYFDALYHNPRGVAVMSGCLAVYLTAYYLSEKILQRALNIWQ